MTNDALDWFASMPRVEIAILIDVAPEVVAGVLLDPELAPAWTAGLERLEVVEGEPGEVGCVGRAHYRNGDRRYVLVDVLEQVTPNRHYVSRITGGGITARVETTLEPIGDGATQLTLRWDGKGTATRTRFLLPLMKRRIARSALADLQKLRRLAIGSTS